MVSWEGILRKIVPVLEWPWVKDRQVQLIQRKNLHEMCQLNALLAQLEHYEKVLRETREKSERK